MKLKLLLLLLIIVNPVTVFGYESWGYSVSKDPLKDTLISEAHSSRESGGYGIGFVIAFQCIGKDLRFHIATSNFINGKGEYFAFHYRVDKRVAREMPLRVFLNSSQGGFTTSGAERIAADIMGGESIFVRAITWDNDFVEARISLRGSDRAIRRVFSDCGALLPDSVEKKNGGPNSEGRLFDTDGGKELAQDQNASKALIISVQKLLASLGFSPGSADGVIGGRTRVAILAFQRSESVEQTGLVSPHLLGQLRKASEYRSKFVDEYVRLIRKNTIYRIPSDLIGNPNAVFAVAIDSESGAVLSASLIETSGVPSWDVAAERAIMRVGRFPCDVSSGCPSSFRISYGPRDD